MLQRGGNEGAGLPRHAPNACCLACGSSGDAARDGQHRSHAQPQARRRRRRRRQGATHGPAPYLLDHLLHVPHHRLLALCGKVVALSGALPRGKVAEHGGGAHGWGGTGGVGACAWKQTAVPGGGGSGGGGVRNCCCGLGALEAWWYYCRCGRAAGTRAAGRGKRGGAAARAGRSEGAWRKDGAL